MSSFERKDAFGLKEVEDQVAESLETWVRMMLVFDTIGNNGEPWPHKASGRLLSTEINDRTWKFDPSCFLVLIGVAPNHEAPFLIQLCANGLKLFYGRSLAPGDATTTNMSVNFDYFCDFVDIFDDEPASKPKVSKFSFQDNLHEGMRTAVTCIVVAGDGPLTTRWLKDGIPLDEKALDATIIPAEEGFVSTITIKSLGHRHNGNYSCLATNDVGTGSYSAILIVKVPPRWILEPTDTYAVAGRSAIIDCQADGVPQPHVRWKVATDHPPDRFKTIVSSSHVHILVNGSLNFRSVETSDAGFYLCEANNGVGSGLSTVVRFTVHSAPQFHSKFMVLSARRGERCTIECSPNGDRPMRFIWRRNGQIVDPSNEASKLQKPMYDIRTEIIRCDFVDHFFTWPTNLFRNVPSGIFISKSAEFLKLNSFGRRA
ncbi:down syndrome cell adhesion molecule-like protein Dscam2 [Trichonephila clavipes]|nr:down syndrome cell adhesion molecule-like protein Dscam2 [Trichonephila clavipes]